MYKNMYVMEINKDDPSVCSGRGNCTDNDVCVCETGWENYDCSIPICFGKSATDENVCSRRGQCQCY